MARATSKTRAVDTSKKANADAIAIGGSGKNGDIRKINADGDLCVHIDGGNSNFIAGVAGNQGDIALLNSDGEQTLISMGAKAT
jgi:hypothetical protein